MAAAAALAVVGIGIALASIRAFRRANTTTHPFAPERTTALVTEAATRQAVRRQAVETLEFTDAGFIVRVAVTDSPTSPPVA